MLLVNKAETGKSAAMKVGILLSLDTFYLTNTSQSFWKEIRLLVAYCRQYLNKNSTTQPKGTPGCWS